MTKLIWDFDETLNEWSANTAPADGSVGWLAYSVIKTRQGWAGRQMLFAAGEALLVRATAEEAMQACDERYAKKMALLGLPASPGETPKTTIPPSLWQVWCEVNAAIIAVSTATPDTIGDKMARLLYWRSGMEGIFDEVNRVEEAKDAA